MNKKHEILLTILLALFALNSISFYLYFSSSNHHHEAENHRDTTAEDFTGMIPHRGPLLSKPWPIIPSYLPWSLTSSVVPKSCEAYFGNGFKRVADVLPAKAAVRSGSSWFRCHYSGTLRSSVCEGGKIRMDTEKIRMSRGGEKLEDVIGRSEEEEMPEFEDGAFEVEGEGGAKLKRKKLVGEEFLNDFLPAGDVLRHTMRELVRSVVVVGENDFTCQEWVEEPTLLVTRFEYANLFHTVTDWYSAYVSSRVTGLPNRPHLVFVDGHCETQLEETWKAMFSSLRYAKNFSGPVCFRHAIFAPLGYETPLFKGLTEEINCHGASAHDLWQSPDDRKTARLSEFGEMIRAAFGFPVNRHHADKAVSGHNVLFVRREDYLAHPRHKGKVESRLSNEQEVFDALQRWASNHLECKINLINGLFAHMSMKDQVRAIQDASVIIGAHGAGLTHIVSATPNTVILEIISSYFRRPHFQLIAQWKGLEYHAINLDGSYANPEVVTDRLKKIMSRLGC
ncbi:beta-(1,2)-xylosyltransferase [Herrania umbratica]|uniref:Beta-(1,2)-xylosyltransferase n=1 Tax=Herrania umbratica TaxID=108875 RepID=A0A6J1AN99_9ROSI|nr:beta-(1,2)-xylosyltransferase [Herrania umbratica]